MDPRLVKLLKPGTLGLTSRRQDPVTGEMTSQGNMRLDGEKKAALAILEAAQAATRAEAAKQTVEATVKAGYEVKQTKDGPKADDLE
jgi:hypothetical protein